MTIILLKYIFFQIIMDANENIDLSADDECFDDLGNHFLDGK